MIDFRVTFFGKIHTLLVVIKPTKPIAMSNQPTDRPNNQPIKQLLELRARNKKSLFKVYIQFKLFSIYAINYIPYSMHVFRSKSFFKMLINESCKKTISTLDPLRLQ